MEKKIDRLVEVDDVTKKETYKYSSLFCNVTLIMNMGKEEMKKKRASGSIYSFGLTRVEAEDLHAKLGEILAKNEKV